VDEWELRERFREAGLEEPEENGYTVHFGSSGVPGPNAPPDAVISRTVYYFDAEGQKVAEAHEFRRSDGTVAASGMPDPKRLWLDGKLYKLRKPDSE